MLPRSHDAPAAIKHISNEAVKAIRRPSMNGPEINWGKRVLPVMVAALEAGSEPRTGPSNVLIGL